MNAPLLCLAGPTASGKTAAALAIAEAGLAGRPVEIVSVDSALVYRGMDIGTAKPSAAERARVPHHLIDLIDPRDAYSAARFVADAEAAIGAISARGAFPLLVGGTMLYLKALFDGLDAMPAADAGVRAALADRLAREGLAALHAELTRLDPPTAARLAPGDTQRILRALEVAQVSGRPLSSFQTRRDASPSPLPLSPLPLSPLPLGPLPLTPAPQSSPPQSASPQGASPQGASPPNSPAPSPRPPSLPTASPPPLISLEPDDRAWLHDRIDARFRRMLDDGLVAEVRGLRARGDLHLDLPSMRCVGYRQTWEALDHDDLAHLPERGVAATRQLAKRQLTWLRGMPQRQRVACDRPDAIERVVELARRLATEALA